MNAARSVRPRRGLCDTLCLPVPGSAGALGLLCHKTTLCHLFWWHLQPRCAVLAWNLMHNLGEKSPAALSHLPTGDGGLPRTLCPYCRARCHLYSLVTCQKGWVMDAEPLGRSEVTQQPPCLSPSSSHFLLPYFPAASPRPECCSNTRRCSAPWAVRLGTGARSQLGVLCLMSPLI